MAFQCMGTYWRTFKSRLRRDIKRQVPSAMNRKRAIALLRPKNITSEEAWEKFVEDTLSTDFQEKSSKFSKMRSSQKLLHTMGRKGYSRMAHDLKRKNPNITGLRTTVWTHGHLRKDGNPINEAVAETLELEKERDAMGASEMKIQVKMMLDKTIEPLEVSAPTQISW
ncbi:uncharacterized protein LOC111411291 [Olea europaea var. sylvestris]|uniref:uncharacterized protein LOC111411291 n=1 Tax=Olea europaea var. sylvestris TaxID=158386 RepID=UPI000C1D67BF|nr:uncharacterized protein LOC111411291 [Olea europaea var. sylvestris]